MARKPPLQDARENVVNNAPNSARKADTTGEGGGVAAPSRPRRRSTGGKSEEVPSAGIAAPLRRGGTDTELVPPRAPSIPSRTASIGVTQSPSSKPSLGKTVPIRLEPGKGRLGSSASSRQGDNASSPSNSSRSARQTDASKVDGIVMAAAETETRSSLDMNEDDFTPVPRTAEPPADKKPVREALYMDEDFDDGKSTPIAEQMVKDAALASGITDLGKLTSLTLHGQCISSIACLKTSPQLRTLDLSGNRLRIIEGIDSLAQLRELRLGCNRIWTMSGLARNTALEELHVQMNRIEEIGKGWLSAHKKLKVFRIDANRLKRLSNLDALVSLTHLDASQNNLTKIEGLGMLAQMDTLCLSFNQISSLSGLDATAWLKNLDLSSNCITSIAGLKRCEKLETLRLSSNQLTDLNGMPRLANLLELYLDDNNIPSCARQLVKNSGALEFLALGGNQISDLSEVKQLGNLTALIDLKLAGNPVCAKTEYMNMAREHLTMLDSLDDIVFRQRAPIELIEGEGESEDAVTQVLQSGGEVLDKAPSKHKELADVLPLSFFEEQMRGMRDSLRQLRADLRSTMLAQAAPAQATAPPPARAAACSQAEDAAKRGGMNSSSKNVDVGTYAAGNAAVSDALARMRQRRGGSSLKDLINQEGDMQTFSTRAAPDHDQGTPHNVHKVLARSDYLMSKHLVGFPGLAADDVQRDADLEKNERGERGEVRGVPEAIRRMNEEIDKRLQAAAEQIVLEDTSQKEDKGLGIVGTLEAAMARITAASNAQQQRPTYRNDAHSAGTVSTRGDSEFDFQEGEAFLSRPGSSKVRTKFIEAKQFSESIDLGRGQEDDDDDD